MASWLSCSIRLGCICHSQLFRGLSKCPLRIPIDGLDGLLKASGEGGDPVVERGGRFAEIGE